MPIARSTTSANFAACAVANTKPCEGSVCSRLYASHPSTPTAESDQALLEEVDDDLSANVPSAMQPLSDPMSTSSAATAQNESTAPLSSQVTPRNITHE